MTDCDASQYRIGAALLQQQDGSKRMGNRRVLLEDTVQGTKELLRHGTRIPFRRLSVFMHHLYLEVSQFIVRIDQNALRWIMNLDDSTGRLMRWRLRLLEFYYEIL